jgi:hypothetical protein
MNTGSKRSSYLWIVLSVTVAAFMSKLDSYIVNIYCGFGFFLDGQT